MCGSIINYMKIEKLNYNFAICKVKNLSTDILENEFCFVAKTDNELSVVCPSNAMPKDITNESVGWNAFRIVGELDFSLVGILADISNLLKENNISIFAISTYNTDYILVKSEKFDFAMKVLESAGYSMV